MGDSELNNKQQNPTAKLGHGYLQSEMLKKFTVNNVREIKMIIIRLKSPIYLNAHCI